MTSHNPISLMTSLGLPMAFKPAPTKKYPDPKEWQHSCALSVICQHSILHTLHDRRYQVYCNKTPGHVYKRNIHSYCQLLSKRNFHAHAASNQVAPKKLASHQDTDCSEQTRLSRGNNYKLCHALLKLS